ncbi:MAG: 16S rRNA (guanine(966)-N(2))-methyltransferase RsmD [Rhodospirillales bacterium]|jgi:16S rRNA (guanine966-N2)-methyltransferase|nr:16S rRNA (guanine(966)-N(2))-methyltransferase RsmD [Rhodospirillales bacterium]
MRIVAGAWRGRRLTAPAGGATRPTADRVRQALFDMLLHAPWGGRALIEDALVLDAFAGTGAVGLEALSRGAARAVFMETDRAAVAALRANIAACGAAARCSVLACDALAAPAGERCALVFLDPPYGQGLVERAAARLAAQGWIGPGAVVIAETAREEVPVSLGTLLAERTHGAARLSVWRMP